MQGRHVPMQQGCTACSNLKGCASLQQRTCTHRQPCTVHALQDIHTASEAIFIMNTNADSLKCVQTPSLSYTPDGSKQGAGSDVYLTEVLEPMAQCSADLFFRVKQVVTAVATDEIRGTAAAVQLEELVNSRCAPCACMCGILALKPSQARRKHACCLVGMSSKLNNS